MPDFKRVRWLGLNPTRESTIAARRFDPERHEELDKPAVDRHGDPLPPKYHTTVDEAVAAKPKKSTAKKRASAPKSSPASDAEETAADDGHQATETKETN